MPRKFLVDYKPIVAEYVAGLASVADLAKKYKCNRTALYNHIKKHNIQVDDNIKTGIAYIKTGISELHSAKEAIISDINNNVNDKSVTLKKQALMKGFEHLERYGDFGSFAVGVAKKLLKKSNELLNEVSTPAELAQVAASTKTSFDLLGITPPKTPLVAIQNNINSTGEKTSGKKLEINVNFIHSTQSKQSCAESNADEKKESKEPIDVEVIDK